MFDWGTQCDGVAWQLAKASLRFMPKSSYGESPCTALMGIVPILDPSVVVEHQDGDDFYDKQFIELDKTSVAKQVADVRAFRAKLKVILMI